MDTKNVMNEFLVSAFNTIMKEEEYCISKKYDNLSVKEIHVIDAVCAAIDKGIDNRATEIAGLLRVTAGTLTTAVTQLEKKGFLERVRCDKDRRVVRIVPTKLGLEANEFHKLFHRKMVEQVIGILTEEESQVLAKGLACVTDFFTRNNM